MNNALRKFLNGSNVVCCYDNYNFARYEWYEAIDYLKMNSVRFKTRKSNLTIEVNGYTMRFAYREDQIIGLRNVLIF